jgi:hypothetical protein
VVRAGQTYRYPARGGIKVRGGLGKEQVTLLASPGPFPEGEVLRGRWVTDRVVHPFYAVDLRDKRPKVLYDPGVMVKKTIEIETK